VWRVVGMRVGLDGTIRGVACSRYASRAGWEDVLDLGNICIVQLVDRGYQAMPVNVLLLVRPTPAYGELCCTLRACLCTRQQYAPDSVSSLFTSKFKFSACEKKKNNKFSNKNYVMHFS